MVNKPMPPVKKADPQKKLSAWQIQQVLEQAVQLHQTGQLQQAEAAYKQVLKTQPKHFDALHNVGIIALQTGNLQSAVELFKRALAVKPTNAIVYNSLGSALEASGRIDEALQNFSRATGLQPNYLDALFNLANILSKTGKVAEAAAEYHRIIQLFPEHADSYYSLAYLCINQGDFTEALTHYSNYINLRPNVAEGYYNRGTTYSHIENHQDAVTDFQQAVRIKPDYAQAYYNLGNSLKYLQRNQEALQNFDRAIALNPHYTEVYWNKALVTLLLGDYQTGWRLYEWRWQIAGYGLGRFKNYPQPYWLGQTPIAGKTLLIYTEQGYGDSLQFCRYVLLAIAAQAKVILQSPEALQDLFTSLHPDIHVLAENSEPPHFDLHCALLSMPQAFHTTLDSIPAEIPYLYAESQKQVLWQQRLGGKSKFRIGLSWSGGKFNIQQARRSISLTDFLPLTDLPVEIHCLQKEITAEEAALLQNLKIPAYCQYLQDFSETAALISEMDMVISIDTAVAHLAGALGKPLWILLPYTADFRWLLDRNDSPWYPNARLFRQSKENHWQDTIATLILELTALIQHPA